MLAIERHVERPEESDLFARYPFFLKDHHATAFLTDTMKVLLTGTIGRYDLAEVLDTDLEFREEEALHPSRILATTADALPGFGIVAAVLGIVVTMGAIAGPAAEIGAKVAAALVGTFLGILLSYGVIGPLSGAIAGAAQLEMAYLKCMRTALIAFARGDAPLSAIEFARRSLDPGVRPSFVEIEQMVKQQKRNT
jgi:chemotaxis protein MotA